MEAGDGCVGLLGFGHNQWHRALGILKQHRLENL